MARATVAVTNIYPPKPNDPAYCTVSLYVKARNVTAIVSVPVEYGVFQGENILKVARNRLRIFSGELADATVVYALTDAQVNALRKDYEPDPFKR